jgi:hypothetical protein
MARKVILAFQEMWDPPDRPVLRVIQAILPRRQLVQRDRKVTSDPQVPLVQQGLMARKVMLAFQEM